MNFLREEELIPTAVLESGDGQPGLKAEYFSGKDLQGKPVLTRVDKSVNLQVHESRSLVSASGRRK
jgi:hypothetical protein